jgi:outer membrane protein OmpU
MYKRLLASTALVAAGVVGVAAGAQAQTAPAAAPLSVTVGGYIEQFFGYVKNKDGVSTEALSTTDVLGSTQGTTFAKANKWFQNSDAEIHFNVKGTLANGITVGARIELEGNTENDTIDESYTFIEGAFGRLELGSTDEAANKTHVSVPGIGKAWSVEKGTAQDVFLRPTNVRAGRGGNRFTGANANEDQQNISYYTPRFAGFQVGATFTPNRVQDADVIGNRTVTRNNTWGVGANFTRNFSGFNVEASAGYTYADSLHNAAATSADSAEEKIMTAGLRLGYAGFAVGGAIKSIDLEHPAAVDNGTVWDIGLSYTFGPATVGVQYMKAENGGNQGFNGDDKFKHLNFGANYTLGPGVDLFGNIFSLKYTDESSTAAADNNKGSGAVAGLRLTF